MKSRSLTTLAMVLVAAAPLGAGAQGFGDPTDTGKVNPPQVQSLLGAADPTAEVKKLQDGNGGSPYPQNLPSAPPTGGAPEATQTPFKIAPPGPAGNATNKTSYAVPNTTLPSSGAIPLRMRGHTALKLGPNQTSPGFTQFVYDPTVIMDFTVRQNEPATIILPPWERVPPDGILRGIVLLDAEAISPNTVEVRSGNVDFDTTLKLFGASGNLYLFHVTVVPFNDDEATPSLAVKVAADMPISAASLMPASASSAGRGPVDPSLPLRVQRPVNEPPAPAPQDGLPPELQRVIAQLPEGMKAAIDNPAEVRLPHVIYEKNPGDAAAIGPVRVAETKYLTIFDFGDDARNRPAPAIHLLQDQIGKDTANLYTLPNYPQIVVADKIGSFTMNWEGHTVCIIRTNDPIAALRPKAAMEKQDTMSPLDRFFQGGPF